MEGSGIDHRKITPYNPSANGLAERFVQTSVRAIKKRLEGSNHLWDTHAPQIQLQMNEKIAALTGSTPFSLMFACTPNAFTPTKEFEDSSNQQWIDRTEFMHNTVFPAIAQHKEAIQQKMIKSRRSMKSPYPIGSFVTAINFNKSSKLEPKWEGPFKIVAVNRSGSYTLRDTDGEIIPLNFVSSQLKLVASDNNDSFEIEKILDDRKVNNLQEYLVKWKGYSSLHNSWEHVSNFNDHHIISSYWKLKRLEKS